MHSSICIYEGAVWQGEDEWEVIVGVEEDQAAMLAHAEQVKAAPFLTEMRAPKQHHQHARAAAVAVIAASKRESRSWGARRAEEQRTNSHATAMMARRAVEQTHTQQR